MDLQETHRLWEACEARRRAALAAGKTYGDAAAAARDHWNAWAETMLAERAALEATGTWQAAPLDFARTPETQDWQTRAEAIFSTIETPITFREEVEFDGWIFPEAVLFECATFKGYAGFEGARFGDARFNGYAGFEDARFKGDAWFRDARFKRDARFDNATFESVATFNKAEFQRAASFHAIKSARAFSLADATFHAVPDFIQSNFAEAPRLDNLDIRPALVQPRGLWLSPVRVYRTAKPRYAQLRRRLPAPLRGFARPLTRALIEPTLFYRACDRASNRIVRRLVRPDKDLPARFVFGYLYGWLSNFGRSVGRPFALLGLLVALFTGVYLGGMPEMRTIAAERTAALRPFHQAFHAWQTDMPCSNGDGRNIIGLKPEVAQGTSTFWQALRISLANAVVIGDLGGTEGARLAYGCLYGLERTIPYGAVAEAERGWFTVTYLPPAMLTARLVQKALSAILLFLFGLALRNMLKVR